MSLNLEQRVELLEKKLCLCCPEEDDDSSGGGSSSPFVLYSQNSLTVTLSGNGTVTSKLQADVKISEQSNNLLILADDGLYVGAPDATTPLARNGLNTTTGWIELGGLLIRDTLIDQDATSHYNINFTHGKLGFNTTILPTHTITIADERAEGNGPNILYIYGPQGDLAYIESPNAGSSISIRARQQIDLSPNLTTSSGKITILGDGTANQYVSASFYTGGASIAGKIGLTQGDVIIDPVDARQFFISAINAGNATIMVFNSSDGLRAGSIDETGHWKFGASINKGASYKVQVQGNIYSTDSLYLEDSINPILTTSIRTRQDGTLRVEFRENLTNGFANILPKTIISPAYASAQWFGFQGDAGHVGSPIDMFTVNMVGNELYFGPGQRLYIPTTSSQGGPTPTNTTFFDIFFGVTKVFEVGEAGQIFTNSIPHAASDTDKYLCSDSGVIKYRTLLELALAVGAITSARFGVTSEDTAASANRAFDLGGFNFTITNGLTYSQTSTTWTVTATNANLKIAGYGAANNGDVLRLVDKTTGQVGWVTSAGGGGTIIGSTGGVDNILLRSDGTGGITLQPSAITVSDTGNISPTVNDVGALGTGTLKWADLFLANGAVINFNNGNTLLTHSVGQLALTGALTITTTLGVGTGINLVYGAASKILVTDASKNIVSSSLSISDLNKLTLNPQGGNYQLLLTDAENVLLEMTGAVNATITVPSNATVAIEVGKQIPIVWNGSKQPNIVAAVGVTIRSEGGALKIAARYGFATLIKRGINEWYLSGNIMV